MKQRNDSRTSRVIRVESVNTGEASPVSSRGGLSGIDKRPRAGRVAVGALGLEGDHIIDLVHHGGRDQAVYCYPREDYDWWEGELGRWLAPGTFGENLTVTGVTTAEIGVGDRLSCGGLVLEVTSPRIPCETFAAHMGDRLFVKRFLKANRTGFYCRVILPGDVGAGDEFTWTPFAGDRVTVDELVEHHGLRGLDAATVERYRAAPLHEKLHEDLAALYG